MNNEVEIIKYKNSFIEGKNQEPNMFYTTQTEIDNLKKIITSIKSLHSNSEHDLFADMLFEAEYCLKRLELSENKH